MYAPELKRNYVYRINNGECEKRKPCREGDGLQWRLETVEYVRYKRDWNSGLSSSEIEKREKAKRSKAKQSRAEERDDKKWG